MKKWMFFLGLMGLTVGGFTEETPESALKRLIEGNQRFAEGKILHGDQRKEDRMADVNLQKPFAIVLGCSDSRVSPEIIFDQGIGEIFVVRVAGNVVGPIEQESVDFASLYLGSSLILVLGHQNCGAVQAVLKGTTQDVETIASLILPAIQEAQRSQGSVLENAIKDNVENVVLQLKKNRVLAKLIQEKKINVVGGYYCIETGRVEILPEKQERL